MGLNPISYYNSITDPFDQNSASAPLCVARYDMAIHIIRQEASTYKPEKSVRETQYHISDSCDICCTLYNINL
jgi:hypothetical protein